MSPRAKAPFVRLNCAALSESLLESELFGHEKGAFTGATRREGRACSRRRRAAPCSSTRSARCRAKLQAKLLRVIETREVQRVGSAEDAPDRRALRRGDEPRPRGGRSRRAGSGRTSIYRLNGITLHIPPLRERRERDPAARCDRSSRSSRASGRQAGARHLARGGATCWRRTPGRATCASCATSSSARCCCARATRSCPSTCRSRAWPRTRSRSRPRRRASRVGAAARGALRPADGRDRRAPLGARIEDEGNASCACWPNAPAARRAPRRSLGMARSTLIARLDEYGVPRPRK